MFHTPPTKAPLVPPSATTPSPLAIPRVVAGYFLLDDTILVGQRKGGKYDLHWEFPGGKREEGETDEQALKREWQEELGCNIEVGRRKGVHLHIAFTFALYYVHLDAPYTIPKAGYVHHAIRYLPLTDLRKLTPLTPGTRMALGLP